MVISLCDQNPFDFHGCRDVGVPSTEFRPTILILHSTGSPTSERISFARKRMTLTEQVRLASLTAIR